MTGELHCIRDNDAVTDVAVMSKMNVRHQQAIAADGRFE
jgi:hypothetical protein